MGGGPAERRGGGRRHPWNSKKCHPFLVSNLEFYQHLYVNYRRKLLIPSTGSYLWYRDPCFSNTLNCMPYRMGEIDDYSLYYPFHCSVWSVENICLFIYLFIVPYLALIAFSSEDSFTYNTYCDTGPWFLRSYPKDQHPHPTVGFESVMQGSSHFCAAALITAPHGRL
jgi:hypothetical protein